MNNIVTIDFDIVMAPSIWMYNSLVPGNPWDNLNSPFLQLASIDPDHYQKLTTLILEWTKELKKEQIFFIHSHENIIKIINPNEQYSITNIDHHHDLGYIQPNNAPDDELTCANWAGYFKKHNICSSFYWLHNINSDMPGEEQKQYLDMSCNFAEYNIHNLATPDYLIMCLSEPWVPPHQR